MPLQPSRACIELVKSFEGLRRAAGRTEAGLWTIGYGHTRSARPGAVISPEDAEALLIYDLRHTAEEVRPLLFTALGQNQFDAVVAFASNIGVDAFRSSEVCRRLNEGDQLGAAATLERWRAADIGGERLVVDGLVRRRAAEKALFLRPDRGFPVVPTPLLRPVFDERGWDPIDPRARAVALEASLDGEPTLTRLEASASAVSQTLAERFRAPSEAVDEPPAPFETPQASDAGPLDEPEPYGGPETEALDTSEVSQAPEPGRADALPPAAEPGPTARPSPELTPGAERVFEEDAGPEPRSRRSGAMIVGLIGILLFGAALFSMLEDRATALNLFGGLLGCVCIAYAAAHLLLPRTDRPTE